MVSPDRPFSPERVLKRMLSGFEAEPSMRAIPPCAVAIHRCPSPSAAIENMVLEGMLFGSFGSFLDRKSTRLNSSHQIISYAVFCLKKKKSSTSRAISSSRRTLNTSISTSYCKLYLFVASSVFFFFFFNDPSLSSISTLSLHDALPISFDARDPALRGGDPQVSVAVGGY